MGIPHLWIPPHILYYPLIQLINAEVLDRTQPGWTVCGGTWGFLLDGKACPKWSKMVQNGPKWSKTHKNTNIQNVLWEFWSKPMVKSKDYHPNGRFDDRRFVPLGHFGRLFSASIMAEMSGGILDHPIIDLIVVIVDCQLRRCSTSTVTVPQTSQMWQGVPKVAIKVGWA